MINTIAAVVSSLIAFISIIISIYVFRRSNNDTSYLDIDKQFSELLKLSLDTPNLRDYNVTSKFYKLPDDDMFKKKYNIYAFMCWNLVETIYDQQKDKKGRFKLSKTWIPVMLEENRLHYTWFKHNLRLFKPEFQRFVTGELNDIDIVDGELEDLQRLYKNFERDFPVNERKELKHLESLMLKKQYKLVLAKHKVFEEIVGYALVYKVEKNKVIWLDYMAIEEKYQDSGYGTLLFNKIIESETKGITGVFMEVEIPDENSACFNEQKKRIQFYERLGAKKLEINYLLPTKNGGVPLFLYFKPAPNLSFLPKEQIKETIYSVFNYIHTDILERDIIFKKFINEIKDTHFE